MRKYREKFLSTLMSIRMNAFHLYSFAIIGGSSILINIMAFFRLPQKWRMSVCVLWSYAYWIGMLVFLQVFIKISGRKNIIKNNIAIYVSKHQSMLETFLFYGLVGHSQFIIKKELLDRPVFGTAMKNLGMISIDRNQGIKSLKKVIKDGKQSLENGNNVIVFPEGTRVPVGEYPPFHRSAMKLASEANVKIVPVAHNFGRFFPKKWKDISKPGIAKMVFMEAISPDVFNSKELTQHCYDVITTKTKEIEG